MFLQKASQAKLLPGLKEAAAQPHKIITKRSGESLVASINQEKLILFVKL